MRADPRPPGVVSDAVLDAALGMVSITVIRARPDGINERPWAEPADQVIALSAMLDAAACAVHLKDIVRAIATRIGLSQRPTHIEIDEPGAEVPGVVAHIDDEGAAERAAEVYAELSERERLVLAYGEEPVRTIEKATGIPRSSVHDTRKRLAEALQRSGAADDANVLTALRAMCEQFDAARTEAAGLPSHLNERDDIGH